MSASATPSFTSRRQSLIPQESGAKDQSPHVSAEAATDASAPPVADHDGGQDVMPQAAWQPGPNASSAMAAYPVDEDLFYSGSLPPHHTMADEDGNSSYREVAPDELLPPPDFRPFFTHIQDTETGESHHPTVHYVFSDDDHDIFTSAALEAMERGQGAAAQATAATTSQSGTEDRVIILDMTADGKTVASASSLSPNWQMVKTTIRPAPSMNEVDAGLMLQISGQEATRTAPVNTKKMKSSNLDDLVKTFGERLRGLDELLGRDENNDKDESQDQAEDKNPDK